MALIKFSQFLFSESDKLHNIQECYLLILQRRLTLSIVTFFVRNLLILIFRLIFFTWFLYFLVDRHQYAQVGNLTSSVVNTHAGTPQGTLSGPNDFRLLINDLSFNLFYGKCVDDTTAVSSSDDPLDGSLQDAANYLCGGVKIMVWK